MLPKRYLRPTWFLVASILLLLYVLFEWIANGFVVEGWVYRMTHLVLPVALFMLASDVLIKYFFRSAKMILLIELILFLGIIYYWIVT